MKVERAPWNADTVGDFVVIFQPAGLETYPYSVMKHSYEYLFSILFRIVKCCSEFA